MNSHVDPMIHSKKNKLNIINTKARHKWKIGKKDALDGSGREFSINLKVSDSDVRLASVLHPSQ
jgi:hypothetical protein